MWNVFLHHWIPSLHNAYRPYILRRTWLIIFFALVLAAEGFLVANLVVRQSSEVFLAAVVPAEILALTNVQRANTDVPRMVENVLLAKAAQAKAEDMAAKGYFSHQGPDGATPWSWLESVGYTYHAAGENLAVRFVDSSDVVEAWMTSPSHRANIIKPSYTEVGVGVANGMYQNQPATYVVEYMASPQNSQKTTVQEDVLVAQEAGVGAILHTQTRIILDSVGRYALRIASEPYATTTALLLLVALILVVAVSLTFFVHIQVQPTHMLLSGGLVAIFALSLVMINAQFLHTGNLQTATALQALGFTPPEVVLTPKAASVVR